MRRDLTALVLAGVLGAGAVRAADVTFTVVDNLSAGQLDESIVLYIDGRSVGVLHIDAAKPSDEVRVQVPGATRYAYALCGRLQRRAADGSVEWHSIDHGGVLTDVDRRVFATYSEDARRFYLGDITPARPAVAVQIDAPGRCPGVVAGR